MLSSSINVTGKPFGDSIRVWYTSYKNDGTTAITATPAIGDAVAFIVATSAAALNGGEAGKCVTRPETALLSRFAGIITNIPSPVGGANSTPGWIEITPTSPRIQVSQAATVSASANLGMVDGSFALDDTTPTFDTCVGFSLEATTGTAGIKWASVYSKYL